MLSAQLTRLGMQENSDRQDSFLRIFEPQRNALWRFVRSMVRTEHEAEDMMSETILQAYQAFHRLRDEQAFVSFLFTIAHRLIKRHRWRRTLFGEYDENAAQEIAHTDPQPDVQMDIVILREALQRLPEKQREAVVLFDILGMSLEEIKIIQGGTLSGVKSRLKRGRTELQRMLGAADDLPEPVRIIIPLVHNQPIL